MAVCAGTSRRNVARSIILGVKAQQRRIQERVGSTSR